jgi:hypothetical protein
LLTKELLSQVPVRNGNRLRKIPPPQNWDPRAASGLTSVRAASADIGLVQDTRQSTIALHALAVCRSAHNLHIFQKCDGAANFPRTRFARIEIMTAD